MKPDTIEESIPIKTESTWLGTLCAYFRDFLETDFKKSSAPKRIISNVDKSGLKTGFNIFRYPSLRESLSEVLKTKVDLEKDLKIQIGRNKHRSKIKKGLLALIKKHIDSINEKDIEEARATIRQLFKEKLLGNKIDPDNVETEFVTGIRNRLLLIVVNPLLNNLDSQLKTENAEGLDMLQTIEDEIGEIITSPISNRISDAIAQAMVENKFDLIDEIIEEVTDLSRIYSQLIEYFESFQTSDAFDEINGLTASIKIKENYQLYLYIGTLSIKNSSFPLLFIPCKAALNNSKFKITFDPHIFINKRLIDYACGELTRELRKPVNHHIPDRINYLEQGEQPLKVAQSIIDDFGYSLALNTTIDLSAPIKSEAFRGVIKIDNGMYFSAFDQSDESLVNDYEILIQKFNENEGVQFEGLISSFMNKNPISFDKEIDTEWQEKKLTERFVYDSPVPVNEEQQKIISTLNKDKCKFISVEGPPGTGKSHTITAIVFNAILRGKNILVLSDKKEALDVVEKKITSILKKVRLDDSVQDPILRLGKHGNSFGKILSKKTIEDLKRGQSAAGSLEKSLDSQIKSKEKSLKGLLQKYIDTQKGINLQDVEQFEITLKELRLTEETNQAVSNSIEAKKILESLENLNELFIDNGLKDLFQKFGIKSNLPQTRNFLQFYEASTEYISHKKTPAGLRHIKNIKKSNVALFEELLSGYITEKSAIFGFFFKRKELLSLNSKLAELTGHTKADRGEEFIDKNVDVLNYIKGLLAALPAISIDKDPLYDLTLQTILDSYSIEEDLLDEIQEDIVILEEAELADYKLIANSININFVNTEDFIWKCIVDKNTAVKVKNIIRNIEDYTQIVKSFENVPQINFSDQIEEIELLKTKKLTNILDKSVVEFANEKRNSAEKIKDIIRKKQKFPTELFGDLKKAFPIIIAGIRDYAEYIPLEAGIFDIVIIDEASQVSIAQALPAFIRAKKVIVFGDKKQFSNVKTENASKNLNQAYKNNLRSKFLKDEDEGENNLNLNQLAQFDIKTSVLDYCDRIANLKVMLRKHFRGYPELISLSSKYFYQGGLQAVKVRGKAISEVICFEKVDHDGKIELNSTTNLLEAIEIINYLKALMDDDKNDHDVMVITPFTDQQKLITRTIYKEPSFSEIYDELNLRVFTFDTCQGEEADIVIYSMVATADQDKLRYIFPVILPPPSSGPQVVADVEENLRLQRINVGFSRAKEKIIIFHSKPLAEFTRSIGQSLNHYKNKLDWSGPDPSETDPNSPMEKKVLGWLTATRTFEELRELSPTNFEIDAQFKMGDYLKQIDPSYDHPKYKVDFLLKIKLDKSTLQIVVEYDGFKEHFVSRSEVTSENYMHYMREEDVERQVILESYGYKFIRINRFNLGNDPVQVLDKRIRDLIENEKREIELPSLLKKIQENEAKVKSKLSKLCSKCNELKDNDEFLDEDLKTGIGRVCIACKKTVVVKEKNKKRKKRIRKERKTIEGTYVPLPKIYLNCPYSEKDECKKLGGKWDRFAKKWYFYDTRDAALFEKWKQ
jgi:superfamily I DNA and/or RNA helicase